MSSSECLPVFQNVRLELWYNFFLKRSTTSISGVCPCEQQMVIKETQTHLGVRGLSHPTCLTTPWWTGKKKDMTNTNKTNITADGSFIRAVGTVHLAVADLIGCEADRGVIGTRVLGWLTDSGLAGLFIWAVLTIDVPITHPALCDALAYMVWHVEEGRHIARLAIT